MEDMIARLEKEATAYEKKAHEQRESAAMNDLMARHARKALEELLKARESVLKYAHDNGQVSANGQPGEATRALLGKKESRMGYEQRRAQVLEVFKNYDQVTMSILESEVGLNATHLGRFVRDLTRQNLVEVIRAPKRGVMGLYRLKGNNSGE